MFLCCFMFRNPAVFAGFRRFTLVHYTRQQKTRKSGELLVFRGKLPVMARGKTCNVPGDQTLSVQGVETGKKRKVGRPCKVVPVEQLKKAIEACRLGIPLERVAILAGFPSGNAGGWNEYLKRNPSFANELELARLEGELELTSVVRQCGNGWQGSAWLLERTRGYVARAQLEHTGKGGKELSVSGALLGAFGGSK
jgi:hypothetical protein